jgi:hypothetical protein
MIKLPMIYTAEQVHSVATKADSWVSLKCIAIAEGQQWLPVVGVKRFLLRVYLISLARGEVSGMTSPSRSLSLRMHYMPGSNNHDHANSTRFFPPEAESVRGLRLNVCNCLECACSEADSGCMTMTNKEEEVETKELSRLFLLW